MQVGNTCSDLVLLDVRLGEDLGLRSASRLEVFPTVTCPADTPGPTRPRPPPSNKWIMWIGDPFSSDQAGIAHVGARPTATKCAGPVGTSVRRQCAGRCDGPPSGYRGHHGPTLLDSPVVNSASDPGAQNERQCAEDSEYKEHQTKQQKSESVPTSADHVTDDTSHRPQNYEDEK